LALALLSALGLTSTNRVGVLLAPALCGGAENSGGAASSGGAAGAIAIRPLTASQMIIYGRIPRNLALRLSPDM